MNLTDIHRIALLASNVQVPVPSNYITDEAGNKLTDESGNKLTTG